MRRWRFNAWKQFVAMLAIVTVLPSPLLFLPSHALTASPPAAGGNPTGEDRARMRAEYEAYLEKEKKEGQERLKTILDAHAANWRPIEQIAPYWKQGDGFSSTIVLNNTRPREIDITVVVSAADGRVLQAAPLKIAATGSIDVPLATLIGNQEGYGQVALRYQGEPLEINAVLVAADSAKSLSVDHPFEMAADFSSNELEGVFYLPASSTRAEIALANTSNQAVSVQVSVQPENQTSAFSQHLAVLPHQTELVNVRPLLQGRNGLAPLAARVVIQHTGNFGDLRVHGMLMDANGYSSNMRFLERTALGGNKLFSPVLPLQGPVSPIVLLTNTNTSAAAVHLEAYYSRNGALEETTLRTVSVPAGGALHADLSRELQGLPADASDIGIVIEHYKDGGLLADMLLLDSSGSGVYQVSPKGYADHPHNVHSFPFRLEGALNTILTIANPSETEEVLYSIDLHYDGKVYGVKTDPLRPGEVRNVNLKTLRDQQTPGGLKEVLPPDLAGGHVMLHFRPRRKRTGVPHADHTTAEALGIASATTFNAGGGMAFVTCWPACNPENWTIEIGNQYYEGVVGDIVDTWLAVYNVNNGYFFLEASDVDWVETGAPYISLLDNDTYQLESPGVAHLAANVTIVDQACDEMCSCVQILGEVLYLEGWIVVYNQPSVVINGFDTSEEAEETTFGVTLSGDVPGASGTLLITATRQGQGPVTIFSGSSTAGGPYTIAYLAQGNSLPAGTYTGLTAQWRGAQATWNFNLLHDGCDDGRSDLVVEYWVRGKAYIPRCEDFRYQPMTWAGNFGWNVIQSHGHEARHPDHALFTDMIDNTMERMGNMGGGVQLPPTYNRVYSCPAHNASIPNAAANSQHIYGNAADIQSSAADWQTIRNEAFSLLDPAVTSTPNVPRPCAEPNSVSGNGHVHLDHRNGPGAFVGGACPATWTLP